MDLIHISQTIRNVRTQRRMTVAQLAEKSGFSKAFISRLENFRVNASIASLNKLAGALGIKMTDLFQDKVASPQYLFGNLDDGEPLDRDEGAKHGIRYNALFYHKLDKKLEPFVVVYTHASRERDFLMHAQDEFFVLLEGEIDFLIGDEDNKRRMKKGDTIYLSKNMPHRVVLPKSIRSAKALIIYS